MTEFKKLKMSEMGVSRPRNPLSAYLFFVKEQRLLLQKEQRLKFMDLTNQIDKLWKTISPEQKKRYTDLAAEDKKRHAAEYEVYLNRPGQITTYDVSFICHGSCQPTLNIYKFKTDHKPPYDDICCDDLIETHTYNIDDYDLIEEKLKEFLKGLSESRITAYNIQLDFDLEDTGYSYSLELLKEYPMPNADKIYLKDNGTGFDFGVSDLSDFDVLNKTWIYCNECCEYLKMSDLTDTVLESHNH